MLKTAFIGNENFFDHMICEWLSEHTDLSLIVWTNDLSWAGGTGTERKKKILKRFVNRIKRVGILKTFNEFLYYVLYRRFLQPRETTQILNAVNSVNRQARKPLSDVQQVRPRNIKSSDLQQLINSLELDATFAVCIDVYLPSGLIDAPKYGSFLWHEGITPEYRGVYSPFWALANKDYDKLGYTLLKMNSKLDAGEIFVQGQVESIDPSKDWHSYIGHKAIIESLPKVKQFLVELERNQHKPLVREEAVDGYYSYPTASALLKLAFNRAFSNNSTSRQQVKSPR